MAIQILGTTARTPGSSVGFVSITAEGQREVVEALLRAATRAGRDATKPLNDACREAMKPVMEAYKNIVPDVTGNLSKSVQIRGVKSQRAKGVGVAVGGPTHVKSGKEWDVAIKGAGNHAWLVEYGTGRRRPGTQGRRTYVNVHQKINGKFRRIGDSTNWVNNQQFERMGRGFYFVMSSHDEPTRQARRGSGYPHDFFMAIGPGETYGSMPATHAMQQAIERTRSKAMNTLVEAVQAQIARIQAA